MAEENQLLAEYRRRGLFPARGLSGGHFLVTSNTLNQRLPNADTWTNKQHRTTKISPGQAQGLLAEVLCVLVWVFFFGFPDASKGLCVGLSP